MEVFVRVVSENMISGERHVCAVSFLTFVALDEEGHPTEIPAVIPETEEEKQLNESAKERLKNPQKTKKEKIAQSGHRGLVRLILGR